jgi:hypothetical protein
MHISYSSINVAKQCWRKYYFKYIEGLEPIDQGPNLKLGVIIHDALYNYYSGMAPADVAKFIDNKFEEESHKVEQSDVENIQTLQAIARGMWDAFPKDMLNFQTILPEHPFALDFNGISIEGRLDGIVQKDGKYWVREVKTTSLQQRQFKERMAVSEQADLYYWAARKLGFPVEGIMYDALHKPMLRKNQSENAQEFGLRIRFDYKQRPEHYFQREYIYKTKTDIKNFEDDLTSFQRDLISKRESGGFYRNHNSCLSFNSECSYKRICFSEKPDELILNLFYKKKEMKDEIETIS